ncbi:hypothetical protein C1645_737495 [Glomus cerebriforme]|uniref:Uncharacterized protein n=1 Tax=Glomus cerebriforme TaxID=658196 RepID=A0A397SYA2_9GLOM|nr:hypothetical protein C1645_737495 [Glomus cerebriforme]
MYKQSTLENDGAELNFMNDGNKYSPRNDQELREILCRFVSKGFSRFTVFIETPLKPFNSWTFPKVCDLYELSNDPNPDIDVYHHFHCGSADLDNGKSKAVLKHLIAELDLRKKITPLILAYEATKSIYSYCYLASGVSLFENNFKIVPEKLVKGHNARLVEVKRDDFKQGFAQATVQMESSLTCHKRKANEIEEYDMDKVWGIVTKNGTLWSARLMMRESHRSSCQNQ